MDPLQVQGLALSQANLLAFVKHMDAPVWVLLESQDGEPDALLLTEFEGVRIATMLLNETLPDENDRWLFSGLKWRQVQRTQREVIELCVAANAELLMIEGLFLLERPLLRKLAQCCLMDVEERRFLLEYLPAFEGQKIRDAFLLRSHRDVQALQIWVANLLDEQDGVVGTLTWVLSAHPFSGRQREHALQHGVLWLQPKALEGELQELERRFPATTLQAPAKPRFSAGLKALLVVGAVVLSGMGWVSYQEYERQAAVEYNQRLMRMQQVLQQEWSRRPPAQRDQ